MTKVCSMKAFCPWVFSLQPVAAVKDVCTALLVDGTTHDTRWWDLCTVRVLARVDNTEQHQWGSINVKSPEWLFSTECSSLCFLPFCFPGWVVTTVTGWTKCDTIIRPWERRSAHLLLKIWKTAIIVMIIIALNTSPSSKCLLCKIHFLSSRVTTPPSQVFVPASEMKSQQVFGLLPGIAMVQKSNRGFNW